MSHPQEVQVGVPPQLPVPHLGPPVVAPVVVIVVRAVHTSREAGGRGSAAAANGFPPPSRFPQDERGVPQRGIGAHLPELLGQVRNGDVAARAEEVPGGLQKLRPPGPPPSPGRRWRRWRGRRVDGVPDPEEGVGGAGRVRFPPSRSRSLLLLCRRRASMSIIHACSSVPSRHDGPPDPPPPPAAGGEVGIEPGPAVAGSEGQGAGEQVGVVLVVNSGKVSHGGLYFFFFSIHPKVGWNGIFRRSMD